MNKIFFSICILLSAIYTSYGELLEKSGFQILPFGEGGQIKMLYDRRQRPQSVFLSGLVHLVINAGGEEGTPGKSKTKPIILSFDPEARKFSDMVTLGPAKAIIIMLPTLRPFFLWIIQFQRGSNKNSKKINYINDEKDIK